MTRASLVSGDDGFVALIKFRPAIKPQVHNASGPRRRIDKLKLRVDEAHYWPRACIFLKRRNFEVELIGGGEDLDSFVRLENRKP